MDFYLTNLCSTQMVNKGGGSYEVPIWIVESLQTRNQVLIAPTPYGRKWE